MSQGAILLDVGNCAYLPIRLVEGAKSKALLQVAKWWKGPYRSPWLKNVEAHGLRRKSSPFVMAAALKRLTSVCHYHCWHVGGRLITRI